MPPSHDGYVTAHQLGPILDDVPQEPVTHEVVAVELAEDALRGEHGADDVARVLAHRRVPVGEAVMLGTMPPKMSEQSDIEGSLPSILRVACN